MKIVQKKERRDRSQKAIEILANILMGLFCVLIILPCMNLISQAVSPGGDVVGGKVYFWPTGIQFEAIQYILGKTNFFMAMKNSLIVTGLGTLISVIVTIMTSYPLSRPEFCGRKFFTFLYVFSMIFFGGMIPAYMVVKTLGLIDTYAALILPFAIVQFNMFMMKNYMEGLPNEVIESASVDGAGDFRTLVAIVCPMAKPVIATVTLLYAVNYWNNYFHAMLYTTSTSMQTFEKPDCQYPVNTGRNIGKHCSQSQSDFGWTDVRSGTDVRYSDCGALSIFVQISGVRYYFGFGEGIMGSAIQIRMI